MSTAAAATTTTTTTAAPFTPSDASAGAEVAPPTAFEVQLCDGSRERIEGADAYQQEQSMTTFFRSDGRRQSVDCWSVRVASFRTDQIVAVRRLDASAADRRHLRPV